MSAQALNEKDYFTDLSVLLDPYAYFEAMREQGPVCPLPNHEGALVITGFAEAIEVLRNHKDFSSLNSTVGAGFPLPFKPEGNDITALMEANRDKYMGGDLLVALDGEKHSALRSVMNRLLTPTRLKANQEFMVEYAEQLVQEAVAKGGCELVNEIATPFVTLVIADLLGVPAEDREKFREVIDNAPPPGNMNNEEMPTEMSVLVFLGTFFYEYLVDRKENPREDVLSQLAHAKYPDGSDADLLDMVKMATFMFAAGQDTSAKLLGNAMRYIVDVPGLQEQLRADYSLLTPFLEEVLRLEGSTKITSRLACRDTKIGDIDVPAGTQVLISLAAANRDPRRWENPNQFQLHRPRIMEHLAFGRGVHTCAGAPLARAEVKVILERFFENTSHIDLNPEKHGTAGNRKLEFEPSFIIRGLANLQVDLTPA